ncbi:MAG: hypothetical protein CUN54_09035, partial [Phototrophicales bacterium]
MSHLKLMIPGPVELEAEVLELMGKPNVPHYGDEWLKAHTETVDMLRRIFQTSGKIFLMPGSGSTGLDAAVHSLFSPGEHVVVGNNGFFGARLTEILEANGAIPISIHVDADTPLDAAAFDAVLRGNPNIVGIAAVHLETSTAVLNPAQEIAAIARKHDKLCFIDAVASLAGTDLRMDEWGIDMCVAASQKALGGAAGLAVIAVGERGWQAIENRTAPMRSWSLDLKRWQWYVDNWGDWHPHPGTMPTAVLYGLRKALQNLLNEGLEARFQKYDLLARRLREGLMEIGLSLFVPEELMTPVLTAAYCPPGINAGQLVKQLETDFQIKITSGFQQYKERVIRIGHMGGAITESDIDELLDALRQIISEL